MIQNLLTADERNISTPTIGWGADSGCTVSRSSEYSLLPPASLLMNPTGSSAMQASLLRSIPVTANTSYRCFAFVRTLTNSQSVFIGPQFYRSDSSSIDSTAYWKTKTLVMGTWTLVSSEFTTPADTGFARVVIGSSTANQVWWDNIVFAEWPEYVPNAFLNLVQTNIPDYILDSDEADPTHPLRRYLDLGLNLADSILTAVVAWDYIPEADGETGFERSALVNPTYYPTDDIAEAAWLPWLAQLVATRTPSSGSAGVTPWFWLEGTYHTWKNWEFDINASVNPAFSLSSIARSSGVVTATLGSQTAGASYTPQTGDIIYITGTSNTSFIGSFQVTVSGTTLTWSQTGANASTGSGVGTFTDLSWTGLENDNPLAYDTVGTLAHLTRTRGTGLRAGSLQAIKEACFAVLDGYDAPATYQKVDGVLTLTLSQNLSMGAGGLLNVYGTGDPFVDQEIEIVTNVGYTTITANVPGENTSGSCWVTDKLVYLEQDPLDKWLWTLQTVESQTFALDLLLQAIALSKPAGLKITHEYTP